MPSDSQRPTAERLLDAAMLLFMVKGHLSTSVTDILHEAKAISGSLYHAFPTKQDVLSGYSPCWRGTAWA